MHKDSSGDQYAEIARSLKVERDAESTLAHASETAVSIVDGCDRAGISLVSRGGLVRTLAPTDRTVARADEMQFESGQGPCLQSIREDETVYCRDVGSEARWPKWTSMVRDELEIRSVLALQLFVGSDTVGALNLYSDQPDAFTSEDRVSALALASHVAVAVMAAQEHDDMASALIHRTVIGQAQGMLMQLLDVSPDQAFAALVRVSQSRNIKLREVASHIVVNGIRPELFE